jgi:hypothetical protein
MGARIFLVAFFGRQKFASYVLLNHEKVHDKLGRGDGKRDEAMLKAPIELFCVKALKPYS